MITSEAAINDIKNKLGLSEEQSEELKKIVEPFYDFQSYIEEKHNISSDECEAILESYIQKEMKSLNLDEVKSEEEIFDITSSLLEKFAKDKGFEQHQSIKTSFINLMNFMSRFSKKEE